MWHLQFTILNAQQVSQKVTHSPANVLNCWFHFIWGSVGGIKHEKEKGHCFRISGEMQFERKEAIGSRWGREEGRQVSVKKASFSLMQERQDPIAVLPLTHDTGICIRHHQWHCSSQPHNSHEMWISLSPFRWWASEGHVPNHILQRGYSSKSGSRTPFCSRSSQLHLLGHDSVCGLGKSCDLWPLHFLTGPPPGLLPGQTSSTRESSPLILLTLRTREGGGPGSVASNIGQKSCTAPFKCHSQKTWNKNKDAEPLPHSCWCEEDYCAEAGASLALSIWWRLPCPGLPCPLDV